MTAFIAIDIIVGITGAIVFAVSAYRAGYITGPTKPLAFPKPHIPQMVLRTDLVIAPGGKVVLGQKRVYR